MNVFEDLLSSPWAQTLGWTLLHSVWQSTLVTMAALLVLRFIPSRYSTLRYLLATAGLASILLLSIGTFFYINSGITPVLEETIVRFYQKTEGEVKSADHLSFSALAGEVNQFVESNIGAIVLCWSIGALLSSLRIFGGWWYIKRLRREAVLLEGKWNSQVQLLATSLHIHKFIPLAESSFIHTPIVIGHLRPMILFPLGICSGLTVEQIESIIIHELVHIKRNDYLVNIIQSFMEAIYFFNPFVWIISSIIRQEREHCCDDAVVKVYGDPLVYVQALATLEETRFSKSGLALSFAQDKNQLLNRIKRIMEKSVKSYSGRERAIPVALLIVDGNATVDSIQPVFLSDTTGKGNSSRHPIQKVVDVNTVVEVEEVVEVNNDQLVDLNLTVPPVPPAPDIEMVVPVDIRNVYDLNTDIVIPQDIELPRKIFSIPARFDLDTLPGNFRSRDWEFRKNYEKYLAKAGCEVLLKVGQSTEILLRGFDVAQRPLNLYAGGKPLLEGTDYVVDYETETVTIINSQILNSGRPIEVRYAPFSPIAVQPRDSLNEEMPGIEHEIKRWQAENQRQLQMLEENAEGSIWIRRIKPLKPLPAGRSEDFNRSNMEVKY
jgi:beta-lactamase regulating signal transducer with metallopeptidase domain